MHFIKKVLINITIYSFTYLFVHNTECSTTLKWFYISTTSGPSFFTQFKSDVCRKFTLCGIQINIICNQEFSALTFLLIAPVSFFMGMPFPFGLESSKRRFSAEYAALMLAVNGGFCAIGAPFSFLSSTSHGFSFTFILGILAYLIAAGALLAGRLDR